MAQSCTLVVLLLLSIVCFISIPVYGIEVREEEYVVMEKDSYSILEGRKFPHGWTPKKDPSSQGRVVATGKRLHTLRSVA